MIYFLLHRGTNLVKIGTTKDRQTLENRLATFACGNPDALTILRLREGGRTIESTIHRNFGSLRVDAPFQRTGKLKTQKGEWFRYEGQLYRFLNSSIKLE